MSFSAAVLVAIGLFSQEYSVNKVPPSTTALLFSDKL